MMKSKSFILKKPWTKGKSLNYRLAFQARHYVSLLKRQLHRSEIKPCFSVQQTCSAIKTSKLLQIKTMKAISKLGKDPATLLKMLRSPYHTSMHVSFRRGFDYEVSPRPLHREHTRELPALGSRCSVKLWQDHSASRFCLCVDAQSLG